MGNKERSLGIKAKEGQDRGTVSREKCLDEFWRKVHQLARRELNNYKDPVAQENARRENATIAQCKADRTQ